MIENNKKKIKVVYDRFASRKFHVVMAKLKTNEQLKVKLLIKFLKKSFKASFFVFALISTSFSST